MTVQERLREHALCVKIGYVPDEAADVAEAAGRPANARERRELELCARLGLDWTSDAVAEGVAAGPAVAGVDPREAALCERLGWPAIANPEGPTEYVREVPDRRYTPPPPARTAPTRSPAFRAEVKALRREFAALPARLTKALAPLLCGAGARVAEGEGPLMECRVQEVPS